MDYRQTLLVLLTALLCGSQVLTATPTEALKKINQNKYLTLSQDMEKFNTKLDRMEAHLQEASVKERQFVLFADDGKTWQEAYDDCIKRNMSLASIESEEENNKVASLIKNSAENVVLKGVRYRFLVTANGYDLQECTRSEEILIVGQKNRGSFFWLSGTDLGHTGRYVWKSTGRDVTYNQWLQGRPEHNVRRNGEVDHCMSVYSGLMRWYDFACSSLQNYICQHWV